jgi:hypothetical protein
MAHTPVRVFAHGVFSDAGKQRFFGLHSTVYRGVLLCVMRGFKKCTCRVVLTLGEGGERKYEFLERG